MLVLSLVVATEPDLHADGRAPVETDLRAGGRIAPAETVLLAGGYSAPAETDLRAGGHIAPAETDLHASITRLKEMLPLYHGEVVEFHYYQ